MSTNQSYTFIFPDDSLLFAYRDANGNEKTLKQAFSQAWEPTGKIALEKYFVANPETKQQVENYCKENGNNFNIEEMGKAIFDKREEVKGKQNDPKQKLMLRLLSLVV